VFARSVGKRLAVGAATLATGFGLMLSIAPAASACPASAPWGPWNGLGYEQQAVVSGLPFHFHHCAPLVEQAPELTAAAPAAAPLVETRPQWRPASEHGVRHRASRHHARHARHARHHGRRFHNGHRHGARYNLSRLSGRTVTHRAFTPAVTRLVPLHTLAGQHPLAHRLGRHHSPRHHHRHHGLRHHRHHRLNHGHLHRG